MPLHVSSTCAHHQEVKIVYTAFGIITPIGVWVCGVCVCVWVCGVRGVCVCGVRGVCVCVCVACGFVCGV